MLFINTILLALHATIGASAPVLDGDTMQVEHHGDQSTYWYLPEHEHNPMITKHLGLRVIVQAVKGPKRVGKAMKDKAAGEAVATKTTTTTTTKKTARPHVRRNNNKIAQEAFGKPGLLESIALAIGIDPKSISEYLNNLRKDLPVQVHALPTCLSQATRQSLTAIEASLSSIPKCVKATGDEIEINPDGIEVDADGLPVCLDEAGENALESIQNALTNLGDCATATPLSGA